MRVALVLVLLATGCASPASEMPTSDPSEAIGASVLLATSPIGVAVLSFAPELAYLGDVWAGPETTSLLGKELWPRALDDDARERFQDELSVARRNLARHPDDELAWIWVGRRLAYLGLFRVAIAHYGQALERFGDSYRLRRHRGHRHLSLRAFDRAIEDLTEAAALAADHPNELEPDGLPNAAGVPVSSTHGNIHYHLGLAHLWTGDLAAAQLDFETAAGFAKNDDAICSSHWWWFVCAKKRGLHGAADQVLERIAPDMDVIENHAYHRLLLLHGGRIGPEELEATEAELYGLSLWHLWRGNEIEAVDLWTTLVDERRWDAFGTISAEVELANRR